MVAGRGRLIVNGSSISVVRGWRPRGMAGMPRDIDHATADLVELLGRVAQREPAAKIECEPGAAFSSIDLAQAPARASG